MGPEEISYLWAHIMYVIEVHHDSNSVTVYTAYRVDS
jgi:hypothetical protein